MVDWFIDQGADILRRDIPPQRWIIDGLLPEGLTLLCGAPKAGKSWLALDLALHVAAGQPFWGHPTKGGKVLYFALEDGLRRLKSRMELLLIGHEREMDPVNLWPCFSVPTIESGFVTGLDSVIQGMGGEKEVSLVILDTLGKVREPSRLEGYQQDYAQLAALKKLADKYHVALLAVHHLRKLKADDPFDMISGTQGLLGAADGAFVLRRNSRTDRNGKLFFTSRDADDQQFALQFDEACRWQLLSADAEQFEFLRLPLVRFLQQLPLPWTGFAADLEGEYTAFCARQRLNADLPPSGRAAAMGRKLATITGELWRVKLSASTRHTARGSLIEIKAV